MKRNVLELLAVWFIATSVGHGATPAPSAPERAAAERHRDPVEAMAEAVQDKQPTKAQLGKIHSIWKTLPEPHKGNLKNDIVSMICIGFLLTGDTEAFGKARSGISDMAAFKAETTERCAECGGTGRFRSRCSACGGSGVCPRCQGQGGLSAPRLQGMGGSASMSCPSCRGSGRCVACQNGTVEMKHPPCNGSGIRVSKEKCRNSFELHRSRVEAYLTSELKSREEKRLAEERRRKEEEFAASQRAKGLVLRDGTWMTPEEKAALDRKDEEEKKFAAEQKAKGLILVDGEWLTAEGVYEAALSALIPDDGSEPDVVKAYRGFEEAEKMGCASAKTALAHVCWIMSDEREKAFRDAGIKRLSLTERSAKWLEAIKLENSPLAKCEYGVSLFLNRKDEYSLNLVIEAAEAGNKPAQVFLDNLDETLKEGSTLGESAALQIFVRFWSGNADTRSSFHKQCELALKAEYLLSKIGHVSSEIENLRSELNEP